MRVVWTAQGSKAYEFIMTCAQQFYSRKLLRKLNEDIKRMERLMVDNPKMGSLELQTEEREYEYRSIVLCKPFKLIYFIHEDILAFFNFFFFFSNKISYVLRNFR